MLSLILWTIKYHIWSPERMGSISSFWNKAIWVGTASQLLIITLILFYGFESVTDLNSTMFLTQDWFVDMSHPFYLWVYKDVWKLFIRLYLEAVNISRGPSFFPDLPISHWWWSSDLLSKNDIIKIYTRERQKPCERHSIYVLYFTAEI